MHSASPSTSSLPSPSTPRAASRPRLEELKIRARILLKSLRGDEATALAAAPRLQRLPRFAARSPSAILAARGEIQLKHALAAVALENDYPTWEAAKQALGSAVPQSPEEETGDRLYRMGCGTLNHWFTSYEEAREQLLAGGGYLLRFRDQFFVCQAGLIENLGLSPDDPDWDRIGRDWVKPADLAAWRRLSEKVG